MARSYRLFGNALLKAEHLMRPSAQRKTPRGHEDEERLTADIIELARQYGRYGYRKIAELLRQAGFERIWQGEGLKVPHQQPKRGRIWLTLGYGPVYLPGGV